LRSPEDWRISTIQYQIRKSKNRRKQFDCSSRMTKQRCLSRWQTVSHPSRDAPTSQLEVCGEDIRHDDETRPGRRALGRPRLKDAGPRP
jgi:hypothetical protein